MDSKSINTFEIGDGMKSISVSSSYYAEVQDDNSTLLLYNPETNNIWIRISVTTFEPKDKAENAVFESYINKAKKESKEIEIVGDKNYFFEFRQSEEDGDQIITYFYDVGYKNSSILISVTTYLDDSTTPKFKLALAEIPQYIASIQDVSLDMQNFFSLTNNDCDYINNRSAGILEINEEELDDFHKNGKTIKAIQKSLDEKKFSAEDSVELQSLGIAFGDYIQYKYPDFQWYIIHDEFGRDFCLKYKEATITAFPQTMISKRVEDDEKINLESLLQGLLKAVTEMIESRNYK